MSAPVSPVVALLLMVMNLVLLVGLVVAGIVGSRRLGRGAPWWWAAVGILAAGPLAGVGGGFVLALLIQSPLDQVLVGNLDLMWSVAAMIAVLLAVWAVVAAHRHEAGGAS